MHLPARQHHHRSRSGPAYGIQTPTPPSAFAAYLAPECICTCVALPALQLQQELAARSEQLAASQCEAQQLQQRLAGAEGERDGLRGALQQRDAELAAERRDFGAYREQMEAEVQALRKENQDLRVRPASLHAYKPACLPGLGAEAPQRGAFVQGKCSRAAMQHARGRAPWASSRDGLEH